MKDGIEITVLWWDDDVIELLFSCSNGCFSGATQLYMNPDGLTEMANSLTGFPSHPSDSRDFELRAFHPASAGGQIHMHFHCLDSAGHAAVDVKLRGYACRAMGKMESAAFRTCLEAAAIDSFVAHIQKMEKVSGATIYLPMAS